MSKFSIDLEGLTLPDAIAAVVEAWYEAQSLTLANLAESWSKNSTEHQTLRQDIIDQTISSIKNGILLPGSKMPTIRKFAEMFKCNKNTVFKAFKIMEEKGIIKPAGGPKSGYVVTEATNINAI